MRCAVILLVAVVTSGCRYVASRSLRNELHTYYVLEKKDASKLDGPYKFNEVLSPTMISVVRNGVAMNVVIRGIQPTGNTELDSRGARMLSTLDFPSIGSGSVYLRTDSTITDATGSVKSVIYYPANRVCVGRDAQGKFMFDNLSYTCPQMTMIAEGFCRVDHSDTDYPLYEVFCRLEELAKKAKRGYWGIAKNP